MATEVQSPDQPCVVNLVKDVFTEGHELVKQQLALVRAEIRTDWDKTKEASFPLLLGITPLAAGVMLISLMLAHLLHNMMTPPAHDPGIIPLWGCYGIVGAGLTALGGGLICLGVRKFRAFNPLPDQSMQAFEENLRWLTNQK